jgi:hypothetical protein
MTIVELIIIMSRGRMIIAQLIKKHEKNNKSTWVPHVFAVIRKENWHYKSSSFRGEELYRGETTT